MTEKKRAAPPPSVTKPIPVKPSIATRSIRYCYRLAQHTVEREPDGWWIIPETGKRQGPFATPQDACIAIARLLCAELSNRHHALATSHGLGPGDPLYGLPDVPHLDKPRKVGAAS